MTDYHDYLPKKKTKNSFEIFINIASTLITIALIIAVLFWLYYEVLCK